MTTPVVREARVVHPQLGTVARSSGTTLNSASSTREAARDDRRRDPELAHGHGAADFEINFISLRHTHHAQGSGYDRLLDYLPGRIGGPVAARTLWQRALTRALRPALLRSGSTWYHRESLLGELAASRHWLRPRAQLFHFLYGENLFRYFGLLKHTRRRHPIVCTYHTPPERFKEVVRDPRHLKHLDAVIVLTSNARAPFVELLGEQRVRFIPHGVDVDHFRPRQEDVNRESGTFRCLCVGSHLRDFVTLARAAEQLHNEGANIRFTVVTKRENHAALAHCQNVELRDRISDDELLKAYQETDAFVLPLSAATANNALLEALACGAPVVVSSVEGISDYLSDRCSLRFDSGDASGLAAAIKKLRDAPDLRRQLAWESRQRALEFRWESVAEQVLDLYAELARGR